MTRRTSSRQAAVAAPRARRIDAWADAALAIALGLAAAGILLSWCLE